MLRTDARRTWPYESLEAEKLQAVVEEEMGRIGKVIRLRRAAVKRHRRIGAYLKEIRSPRPILKVK